MRRSGNQLCTGRQARRGSTLDPLGFDPGKKSRADNALSVETLAVPERRRSIPVDCQDRDERRLVLDNGPTSSSPSSNASAPMLDVQEQAAAASQTVLEAGDRQTLRAASICRSAQRWLSNVTHAWISDNLALRVELTLTARSCSRLHWPRMIRVRDCNAYDHSWFSCHCEHRRLSCSRYRCLSFGLASERTAPPPGPKLARDRTLLWQGNMHSDGWLISTGRHLLNFSRLQRISCRLL